MKRVSWTCNICKKGGFKDKEKQVDHIEPVMDINGYSGDKNILIDRMFPLTGWQVLCKPCHYEKSQKENSLRNLVDN